MWLAASSFAVPDGVLATLTTAQLSGKPHQGVPAKTLASPPGIGECNSTAAIGLQASLALNGLRQSERARYYGSALGRFSSPDPVFASKYKLADPQQWNLYAYARNNPLSITDPTGLDFNITGCGKNSDTCQNNLYGATTTDGDGNKTFTATRLSNDEDGGLVDQNGNSYSGTFDQSGFHFASSDGSVAGGGQFVHNSDETDLNGSGIFSGVEGKFVSDCGGTCQGRGSLYETQPGAFGAMEGALNKQGGLTTALDLLSGAHNTGTQWKDSSGLIHVILNGAGTLNSGKMEMHFEGHPTSVDVTNFVLHMVDTIHDGVGGNAKTEKNRVLP